MQVFVPWFQFNISHHINHLSFGIDYPGLVNPLDGMHEPAAKRECWYCTLGASTGGDDDDDDDGGDDDGGTTTTVLSVSG